MEMYQRIRHYIDDHGLVVRKVAERARIGHKKFYRQVNGQTKISVDEYEKICRDGLGIEPGYFFALIVSETENTA